MKQAVGLVEVAGLATAIEVSDTMLKVASVDLIGIEKAKGFGWMTIKVVGDVAAVKASVEAGSAKASTSSNLVSAVVIPRPAENLDKLFFPTMVQQETSPVEATEFSDTSSDEADLSEKTTADVVTDSIPEETVKVDEEIEVSTKTLVSEETSTETEIEAKSETEPNKANKSTSKKTKGKQTKAKSKNVKNNDSKK